MSEINRQDMDRIHERLDQVRDDQASMRADLAVMAVKLAGIPPLPSRPCPFFEKHIEYHKDEADESKRNWKDVIMGILTPVLYAIGGGLVAIFGFGKMEK